MWAYYLFLLVAGYGQNQGFQIIVRDRKPVIEMVVLTSPVNQQFVEFRVVKEL